MVRPLRRRRRRHGFSGRRRQRCRVRSAPVPGVAPGRQPAGKDAALRRHERQSSRQLRHVSSPHQDTLCEARSKKHPEFTRRLIVRALQSRRHLITGQRCRERINNYLNISKWQIDSRTGDDWQETGTAARLPTSHRPSRPCRAPGPTGTAGASQSR